MSRNERGFLLAISCYAFRLVGSRLACVGLTEQAPPIVSADTAIHPNAHVFKMISANRRSIPINRALNSGTMIRSAHSQFPALGPCRKIRCVHRSACRSQLCAPPHQPQRATFKMRDTPRETPDARHTRPVTFHQTRLLPRESQPIPHAG